VLLFCLSVCLFFSVSGSLAVCLVRAFYAKITRNKVGEKAKFDWTFSRVVQKIKVTGHQKRQKNVLCLCKYWSGRNSTLSATVGCDEDRESDHRASELHGGRGAHQASDSRERSVLPYRGKKSVFAGRNAADTRRPVQQSRDRTDVSVS